jgi:putative tryptophan/tyrosine transport system substrate-binding protein
MLANEEVRRAGMLTKTIVFLLLGLALASVHSVEGQQSQKVAKIGWLTAGAGSLAGPELFRQEIRTLGHVEGKNITFEYRYAEGKPDRVPVLVDELLRLKVDVLVVNSTPATLAAKNATKIIPIVFHNVADPVAVGLVDSLARPGGNITGFTFITAVLAGKRLELLKETIPKLSRVSVVWNPQNPGNALNWKESQLPARELGLQLHSVEVSSSARYESAFKEMIEARSSAIAVMQDPVMVINRKSNRRPRIKKSAAGDIPSGGFCRERWLNVLRSRPVRSRKACCVHGG